MKQGQDGFEPELADKVIDLMEGVEVSDGCSILAIVLCHIAISYGVGREEFLELCEQSYDEHMSWIKKISN